MAILDEAREHVFPARKRTVGVPKRMIVVRSLRQRRKKGRLMQLQIVQRLSKIGHCGRRNTVGALAEIDFVEVELEDPLLVQGAPDPYRENSFADLPDKRRLSGEQHVLRYLLRDGRRSLQAASRGIIPHVADHGLEDPGRIHAGMRVEVLVLRTDEGLLDPIRNLLDGGEDPVLLCEHRHRCTVGRMHPGQHSRLICGENLVIRQIAGIPPHHCGHGQRCHAGESRSSDDQPFDETQHARSSASYWARNWQIRTGLPQGPPPAGAQALRGRRLALLHIVQCGRNCRKTGGGGGQWHSDRCNGLGAICPVAGNLLI